MYVADECELTWLLQLTGDGGGEVVSGLLMAILRGIGEDVGTEQSNIMQFVSVCVCACVECV